MELVIKKNRERKEKLKFLHQLKILVPLRTGGLLLDDGFFPALCCSCRKLQKLSVVFAVAPLLTLGLPGCRAESLFVLSHTLIP